MNRNDSGLTLLLGRLRWPSGMVRERACVELAHLLADGQLREWVEARLLSWIDSQLLESLACIGLLPFCCAKEIGVEPPAPQNVAKAIRKPSILAWLLQRDLADGAVEQPRLSGMHFKTADSDFKPEPFFERYLTTFLPPIYEIEAEELGDSFIRQWAFEWTHLHTTEQRPPRVPELSFWLRWSHRRLLALDTTESEFYRSAFLRALAWAAATKRIDSSKASYHADRVCPVNLDLWRVTPRQQPKWWPKASPSTGTVDTVPNQTLEELGRMWAEQSNQESVLAAASGVVTKGDFTFEIQICGLVQACLGSEPPDLEDVFERCDRQQVVPYARFLRIQGPVTADDGIAVGIALRDWSVWPLAARLRYPTIPRWQWWRGARGVWAPSPLLLSGGYEVTCAGNALSFGQEQDGKSLAIWFDWMHEFEEMYDSEMPPSTGHVLLVKRDLVEDLARRQKGSFAWLCRWRAYHRKSQYGDRVDKSEGTISFGTTSVIQ